jgi:hypothetical protein
MVNKYGYLKKYINSPKVNNIFYPVSDEAIKKAEGLLKIEFPPQLKEFYREIGYGFLVAPENPPNKYSFYNTNRINPPGVISDILVDGQESGLISREAYEDLEPGDLPFFEIGDSCRYLIMKLNSDNPNAVWSVSGIKIEDSFEKFIWRLYYESTWFYDDIIENFYKERVA